MHVAVSTKSKNLNNREAEVAECAHVLLSFKDRKGEKMTHHTTQQQRNAEEQARQTAEKAKVKAQETVENVSHEAQQQARNVVNTVQQRSQSAVNTQKEQAANQIDDIASAFRETGNSLREQNNEWIAGYADNLADQMEQFAGYLHEGDMNRFLSDARDLARSKPEIFLGGAFTLGLVAARFLKSSSPNRNRYSGYDYSGIRNYDQRPGRSGWDYSQEWTGESVHEARYESDYLGATEDTTRRPDPQATASMGAPSPETSRPIAETTRTRPAPSPGGTQSTSMPETPATTGGTGSQSRNMSPSSDKEQRNKQNKEDNK